MIKIQQQIEEMDEQLKVLVSSDENKLAIDEYGVFLDELLDKEESLKERHANRSILKELPEPFEVEALTNEEQEQHEKVFHTFHSLKTKWEEQDYRVRQEDEVDNFLIATDVFINFLAQSNKTTWVNWVDALSQRFDVPEVALKSQFKVPHLKMVAESYVNEKVKFDDVAPQLPRNVAEIKSLENITRRLEDLKSSMVFDFPPEVVRFFNIISSSQGRNEVPLSIVSKEIIQWLEENGELENYVVRRKAMR